MTKSIVFIICNLFILNAAAGQVFVEDPFFESAPGSMWKTKGTVDYSSAKNPTWWHTYDSVCGPDSTPIVGVAFSKRNPEYIYTKLTKPLTKGETYTITVQFKLLNTSKEPLECLSFALTKNRVKNTSSLRLGAVHCISALTAEEESGWFLLHGELLALGQDGLP